MTETKQPVPRCRVMHLAHGFTDCDFVDTVLRYCDDSKYSMMACVFDQKTEYAIPDLSTSSIPLWKISVRSRRAFLPAAAVLAKLLRRERVQILHVHHYEPAIIGWLATRKYKRTALVVGRHYSDAIYRSSSGLKKALRLAIEKRVNCAATRIIAPSTYIQSILTEWQGVPEEKVSVIPYGFVSQKYRPVRRDIVDSLRAVIASNRRFMLGTFGRLHEEKGHRFLIDAIALLRSHGRSDIQLVIVGDGPERQRIEAHIRRHRLCDSVSLLGFRRDVLALMSAVDAVVQPTLQEAFSQVMVESLWMCKPLIITRVSGATDVIDHGKTGLLVNKADPAALSEAILTLAQRPELCHELSRRGRSYVEQHLTIEQIIRQYERCYSDIVTTSSGTR